MQHIEDYCEDKAREGGGSFAIAHAIYTLAREQKVLAIHVGHLDEIAGALLQMVDAVKSLDRSDA